MCFKNLFGTAVVPYNKGLPKSSENFTYSSTLDPDSPQFYHYILNTGPAELCLETCYRKENLPLLGMLKKNHLKKTKGLPHFLT